MPRGDRTGPEGMGQRTGRGLGFCSGYQSAGFTRGQGAGFGFGNGGGRGPNRNRHAGMRRNYYPQDIPANAAQENTNSLKVEAKTLMDRLKEILDITENPENEE